MSVTLQVDSADGHATLAGTAPPPAQAMTRWAADIAGMVLAEPATIEPRMEVSMSIGTKAAAKAAGLAKDATKVLEGYSSIFRHLAREHAEVGTMMRRVADSSAGSAARQEVFAEIYAALTAHAHGEEKEFYPVLRRIPELEDLVSQCLQEHKAIERYLQQLEGQDRDTASWLQLFEQLQRAVEAHVDREENQLFPRANELLSGDEAKQVYNRYEQVEQREKTQLAP